MVFLVAGVTFVQTVVVLYALPLQQYRINNGNDPSSKAGQLTTYYPDRSADYLWTGADCGAHVNVLSLGRPNRNAPFVFKQYSTFVTTQYVCNSENSAKPVLPSPK